MNDEWCVVYDFCPHGGIEVVVVKCLPSGMLVAFCPMCNAAWLRPCDITDSNDNYVICADFAPDGICCPSPDEVAESHWMSRVTRRILTSQYIPIGDINDSLRREHEERTSPRPRPTAMNERKPVYYQGKGPLVSAVFLTIGIVLAGLLVEPWFLISLPFAYLGLACSNPNFNCIAGLLPLLLSIIGGIVAIFAPQSGLAIGAAALGAWVIGSAERAFRLEPIYAAADSDLDEDT